MSYEELQILYKYLYNNVDSREFAKAVRACVPQADTAYCDDKWYEFRNNHIGFVVLYGEDIFNYFQNKIKEINYKG